MGRDATKAAGNPWYQARKKAAEYDDRLCSRESAAEQLGMSVSSLADAELGNTKFMPVDKAVLMADRYNAPWLLNHYCLNECPIGCRHSLSDEVVGIDRVTVKLLKSLKTEKLGDVKDTLLDIAADGKITEDEKPALQEVLAYLDDLAKTVSELKTIGEMALNEDGDAHGSKYLVCHKLKMAGYGENPLGDMGAIGIGFAVGSVSEGGSSISFGANQSSNLATDAELGLTAYGVQFLQLRRMVIVPIHCSGELDSSGGKGKNNPCIVPVASDAVLGGIKVRPGSGLKLEPDGTLSVDREEP